MFMFLFVTTACHLLWGNSCVGPLKPVTDLIRNGETAVVNELKTLEADVTSLLGSHDEKSMVADEPVMSLKVPTLEELVIPTETVHELIVHRLPDMQTYMCMLCTNGGDIYTMYADPWYPRRVSYYICEDIMELETMAGEPFTNEVALGFFLRPSTCYSSVALRLYDFGNEVSSNLTEVYGGSTFILEAVERERRHWLEVGEATVLRHNGSSMSLLDLGKLGGGGKGVNFTLGS